MIVADRKPLDEIEAMVADCRHIMIVGCKGCVTVCNVGGLKEVQILSLSLKIMRKKMGKPITIEEELLERQCDPEYLEKIKAKVGTMDAVISMACGVGPQFLSAFYPDQRFFPAVNTTFFGGAVAHGIWEERCAGCGTCIIHHYDGMCPIARCSKSLMNGPCGGSNKGACEIDPNVICIWDSIVRKKMEQGRMEDLLKVAPAKVWTSSNHGGPRRRILEELTK
jgi:ferredoxin